MAKKKGRAAKAKAADSARTGSISGNKGASAAGRRTAPVRRRRKIRFGRLFFAIIFATLFFWCAMLAVDYSKVMKKGEMPLFAAKDKTAAQGVDGIYNCMGYYFNFEGDKVTFYLLGKEVSER